jgi:hypothetical protein
MSSPTHARVGYPMQFGQGIRRRPIWSRHAAAILRLAPTATRWCRSARRRRQSGSAYRIQCAIADLFLGGRMIRSALVLLLLGSVGAGPLVAQEQACSYASCALRIQSGFFRSRVVAGRLATHVATIGGFGTDLEDRLTLPDSAAAHVRRFDSLSKTATLLSLTGVVAWAAMTVVDSDNEAAHIGLAGLGLALTIAGAVVRSRGSNELNAAVWWYNRQFSR